MKSILEELWYGNIGPNTGCRDASAEEKQLMGYISKHHEDLESTLTDKQKETLEKFDDCYAELMEIEDAKRNPQIPRPTPEIAKEIIPALMRLIPLNLAATLLEPMNLFLLPTLV